MPTLHVTTFVAAPAERLFNLSRSINFHIASQAHANEQAVEGKTTGLINLNETVTWQARHLFKNRQMVVKITAMQPHTYFEDTMVQGDFATFSHQHHFKPIANGTIMIDLLTFSAPYGWLGKVTEKVLLTRYLKRLLLQRNELLKDYAESGKWKDILTNTQK